MSLPKHLQKRIELADPSNPGSKRRRAGKRENRLAKELGGRTTVNSGAAFHQNDVITDEVEIEDKTTTKGSFTLKADYLLEVEQKCKVGKMPVLTVHFETTGEAYAVIKFADFKYLIER